MKDYRQTNLQKLINCGRVIYVHVEISEMINGGLILQLSTVYIYFGDSFGGGGWVGVGVKTNWYWPEKEIGKKPIIWRGNAK